MCFQHDVKDIIEWSIALQPSVLSYILYISQVIET